MRPLIIVPPSPTFHPSQSLPTAASTIFEGWLNGSSSKKGHQIGIRHQILRVASMYLFWSLAYPTRRTSIETTSERARLSIPYRIADPQLPMNLYEGSMVDSIMSGTQPTSSQPVSRLILRLTPPFALPTRMDLRSSTCLLAMHGGPLSGPITYHAFPLCR